MRKQTSFKIWQGPSAYNGEEIACILTNTNGSSKNPKTGPMIQSWILPVKMDPKDAIQKNNGDACCCGDCPLKPSKAGFKKYDSCYVGRRVFQAPRNVWLGSIKRPVELDKGIISLVQSSHQIRYGSYGDIAMIPKDIFEIIHTSVLKDRKVKTHTAYTHQHKKAFAYWTRRYAMASIENKCDGQLFRSFGWRTFRVASKDNLELDKDEIICPNITRGTQCIDCGLCDGKRHDNDNRKSIIIPAH